MKISEYTYGRKGKEENKMNKLGKKEERRWVEKEERREGGREKFNAENKYLE